MKGTNKITSHAVRQRKRVREGRGRERKRGKIRYERGR
jgi:hypothetical protein